MKRELLLAAGLLAACSPIEEETETEAVGEAQQAICFGDEPPSGFTPSVERSLDGAHNAVRSDGFHGPDPCSFYSMGVDTSPDRAKWVTVQYATEGACSDADPAAQQAFVWTRYGSGIFSIWDRQEMPMDGDDDGESCVWSHWLSLGDNSYSRIIVAARGEQPDGSPVAPLIRVSDSSSLASWTYDAAPEVCPVPFSAPTTFDSSRSLDWAATSVSYSGLPSGSCDLVSMTVDTNPDRARRIEVDLEGDPSEIDVDSIQIYAWLSTSTTTSRTLLVPTDPDGTGYHASHALSASNNYVRVSVAARAVRDDGTALDNIRVRVRE